MVTIKFGFRIIAIVVLVVLLGVSGPATAAPQVYGYADLHAHQFANLGLGGLIVWGAPFSPDDDPQKALPYSDFMNVDPTFNILFPLIDPINPYVATDVLGLLEFSAPVIALPPIPFRPGWETAFLPLVSPVPMYPAVAIHGPNGMADALNLALTDKAGHKVGGYPEFDGWPAYDVMTAQQMYYQWLERSWRGGQRLMVMLAVNNKTLCSAAYHRTDFGCEDMPAIKRQIDAAKELETFIDNQDDGSINGSGWYRIVYTAAQARAGAAAGKLAVVLGVETPALLGCTVPAAARGECTAQSVRAGVQHLYDIGVRHVYPVHNADNAFGGTALYKDLFDINSAVYNEGQWMLAGACPQNSDGDPNNDIRYHSDLRDKIYLYQNGVNTALDEFDPLTRTLLDLAGIATTPVSEAPEGANCNPRGLTELGRVLIDELVSHKMVIDVDHTSTVTFNDILTKLENYANPYPAVTLGHASIVEMGRDRGVESETNRNERNKDISQLKRVRNLGGTLAVILEPDDTDHVVEYLKDGSPIVPFICSESSESWAQQYLAAREIMGPDGAIALGSDFNGLAGWPAPRFGDKACNGNPPDPYYPEDHVPSSFPVHGRPNEPELTQYMFGYKTYDYNVDGLAHVGLLPDFIQDLIGLASSDSTFIEPLFKSAEAYIQSWEGIDAANLRITSISSPPSPAATGSSFTVADITGNRGRSATGSTTVTRFYLSADAEFSADDIVIGERTVPAINFGSGLDAETQVSIPAAALSGAYYHLIACADATRMVLESSEYDNCLVSQDTIQIGEPDLVVTGISTDPSPPVPGQSVAVTLAIKNQGAADAGSFNASFYKNDRYNCELICQSWGCVRPCNPPVKTPDFTCSSPGVLEAGATVICSGTVSYDAGSFNAYADVDNDNAVLESNEDNNIFGPQGITIISGPDLIIQEITANPSSPVPGQSVAITVTVKNQGDTYIEISSLLAIGDRLRVDFYKHLPTGSAPAPPGDTESFSCVISESPMPPNDGLLAPGGTAICSGAVTYPAAGTFNMWGYVDSTHVRVETAEGNNVFGPKSIIVREPCADIDGDGYGSPGNAACTNGSSADCNDNDAAIHPGSSETCDGVDNNCNSQTDEGFDADSDGIANCFDNCPAVYNPGQANSDASVVGTISYWKLNEGTGTNAGDAVGNNPGVIHGAAWTTGPAGTALSFDGLNDYVEAGPAEVINTFTMELWAYPDMTHNINPESGSGVGGTNGQTYVVYPSQGDLSWGSGHAGAGISVGVNGISVYEHADNYMPALLVWQGSVSGWTHIAVVYENGQPKLYVNGELARTGLTSAKSFIHPGRMFGGGEWGYFKGLIDEIAIYSRALTAVEIQQHHEDGLAGHDYGDDGVGDACDSAIAPCAMPTSLVVPIADADGAYTVNWGASTTSGVTYMLQEAADQLFKVALKNLYIGPNLAQPVTDRQQKQSYYYRVKAIKAGYADSDYRTAGNGCAVPGWLAAKPASLMVPVADWNNDGAYNVSWGASGTLGVAYVLEEATNPAFYQASGLRVAYTGTERNAAITGRDPDKTYYYRVKAIRPGYRDSVYQTNAPGCAVPGTTVVTAPPTLTVPNSDGDGTYTVTWGASATPGVAYVLEEATSPNFMVGLRIAYSGTALSRNFTGRPQNVTYYYRVKAVKAGAKDSAWRMAYKGCALPGTTTVDMPTAVSVPASDADGAYAVSWSAALEPGVKYFLQEATDPTFTLGLRTAYFGVNPTANITGRTAGKTYYYRVQATKPGLADSNKKSGANGCVVGP